MTYNGYWPRSGWGCWLRGVAAEITSSHSGVRVWAYPSSVWGFWLFGRSCAPRRLHASSSLPYTLRLHYVCYVVVTLRLLVFSLLCLQRSAFTVRVRYWCDTRMLRRRCGYAPAWSITARSVWIIWHRAMCPVHVFWAPGCLGRAQWAPACPGSGVQPGLPSAGLRIFHPVHAIVLGRKTLWTAVRRAKSSAYGNPEGPKLFNLQTRA